VLVACLAACGATRAPTAETTTATRATPSTHPVNAARRVTVRPSSPASRLLGLPAVAPGPVPGYVLIADRNNDRLLIVSPSGRIVWRFPRSGDVRPGQSFHDPDDAFFTPGYRAISINEEFNETASLVAVRAHRIIWSFGHAGVAGSSFGYLSNPDDAYLLKNGLLMVADIKNCRVLFIDHAKKVVREIGRAGDCTHDPPAGLSSPNGATPLADGGVLVTEIGGWVDRIGRSGQLVYAVRTPTTYPSDAQLLPNGNILVAGFNTPGRVDELTPSGRIVWTYDPPSGPGALDRPSLAVRWPNGLIAVTDDWHHRIVVIDPRTKQIVWSYGHLGTPGTAAGYLDKPDGLDLLPATIAAPRTTAAVKLHAARVGSLPVPLARAAAVALPDGRLVVAGGLTGGTSTDQVLEGKPNALRRIGRLPVPGHDAAGALAGASVDVFGGGQSVSVDNVVRIDPSSGATRVVAHLDEPLSDLGATVIGGKTYLVGGYTGSRFASAVLRYLGSGHTTTAARLPTGLRYAGVAALGGKLYVAGGVTTGGETDAVEAVDVRTGAVRQIATLPAPTAYGALVGFHGALYLIGGKSGGGTPLASVLRIDPVSGRVTRAATLPQPLAEPAAVTRARDVIVVGGESSSAVYSLRP
jgi:N-acetylneuraminic acid mutarotase